jgi:putative toxin-antitoxin system antitoxin component (TIGR02293 family)
MGLEEEITELQDVAEVLGVRRPKTPADLVRIVADGLPLKSLARISDFLAPADSAFKYHIVPKASLARRKGGKKLSPSESALVARLARIWALAFGIWRDEDDARDFLNRRHQLLGGQRPIEMAMKNEIGARLVEDLLGRIQSGVAV